MTGRRAVWEVARRELVERSRSRVWRVSLVVLVILSVGGAIASARLSSLTPTDSIGVVGARSVALQPAIRQQARAAGRRVRLRQLASVPAASRAVRDGAVAVALIDGSRVLVKSSRSLEAVRVVQNAARAQGVLDRLRSVGLTDAQALSVMAPRALPVELLEPNARNVDRNRGLLAVGLVALLIVLVFYGQAVAQGVTEEKSSRVVELLLTTVSPRRLLAGKVLGIGLLGLAQLLLAGGAALAAGRLAGGAGLPPAAPEAVALVLLWFVLGYILYSVAFAAVGALASRQEDLQTAMMPLTFLMIASFYLALIVANGNPDGMLARVAAFLPPFSPMVVPARMVLGDMTTIELAIAVAIDLLATIGPVMLAARIYERAILRIGAPVNLRRILAGHPRQTQPPELDAREPRHGQAPLTDRALQAAAVVLLLAGVLIGLNQPLAIALVAFGLLLIILRQVRSRGPHRPAH